MNTANHSNPDPDSDQQAQVALYRVFQSHPLGFTITFETILALMALGLALLTDLEPWLEFSITTNDLLVSLAATAVLTAVMLLLLHADWRWVLELNRMVHEFLGEMFRNAGPGAVFSVALMAGLCEELLFRGVIQAGLAGPLGPTAALLIASLLFGLAHAVNLAYFALAFLVGLYLGALYLWTGNLLVPILVHFLYDWIILHWLIARIRKPA